MTPEEARQRFREATGRSVRIAVVDSGWSSANSDPRVLELVAPREDRENHSNGDLNGHGTWCGLRVLQVAPEAEILPVRVFHDRLETSVSRLCEGIELARASRAKVINLSLATQRADAIHPIYRVCEAARREGIVVVAAALNRGGQAVPAFLEPVLSVDQGQQTDLLDFSYEPGAAIECTAAAQGVPGLDGHGRSHRRGGSSTAAATLSGIVARLLEVSPGDLDHVRSLLSLISASSASANASSRTQVIARKGEFEP